MRTPSFSYMGGKAKLRGWLMEHFPKAGRIYGEPFVGRGNVLWEARKRLSFDKWIISDLDTSFFRALRTADLEQLPDKVTKETFGYWKTAGTDIACLIENRVTFAGKGWEYGIGDKPEDPRSYSAKCYKPMCTEARRLLDGVEVLEGDWQSFPYSRLTSDDFLYFDPPYYGTKAMYSNIDHVNFIQVLNSLPCKWAVSGYDNPLYDTLNCKCKYKKVRDQAMKTSDRGSGQYVEETLWTNYENP